MIAVQAPHNMLSHEFVSSQRQNLGSKPASAVAAARSLGLKVFSSVPLQGGEFSDEANSAFQFVVDVAEIDCILVGAKKSEHVHELLEINRSTMGAKSRFTRSTEGQAIWVDPPVRDNIQFHIDYVRRDYIEGWAVTEFGSADVQIIINGEKVANATTGIRRLDLLGAENLRIYPRREESGFHFRFSELDQYNSEKSFATVQLAFCSRDGTTELSPSFMLPLALDMNSNTESREFSDQ